MIKIEVLKKIEYKGCSIYIRRIGTIFEYLIFTKKDLYSEYFDIKPTGLRGKTPLLSDYTEEQLQNILKMVYLAAHTTVDKLKK